MINYIINLDRRKDRWDECMKRLKESTELKKDIFIRISAFDGYNNIMETKRCNLEHDILLNTLKKYNVKVKKGELGCLLSHYITLNTILLNEDIKDDDYVGIYEDDFMYSKNFEINYKKFKQINLTKLNVELLYLGGRFTPDFSIYEKDNVMFEKTLDPNIFFRKNGDGSSWSRTTHCYIIKKNICRKIIDFIIKTISKNHSLSPIDYILENIIREIKTFDFFPHLYYSKPNYKTDVQNNDTVILHT